MSIDINKIFSDVQDEINDLARNRVQHGEYVDLMNDVAMDVAEETEIWVNRFIHIPNPLATLWTNNTNYIIYQIVTDPTSGNYYICTLAHTSNSSGVFNDDIAYWTLLNQWSVGQSYTVNDIVWIAGPVFYQCIKNNTSDLDNTPPNEEYWAKYGSSGNIVYHTALPYTFNSVDVAPFRIVRVVRGGISIYNEPLTWTECREYSQQAISNTISGNPSFDINRTQLGAGEYLTQFADIGNMVNGSITLIFAEPFATDEVVVIDYISNRPFQNNPLTLWDPNIALPITVPDFLRNVFKWGLQWKVCERLYTKGDPEFKDKADRAHTYYERYLRKAVGYTKMLRSNQHNLKIQPINWLDEEY